ncbi:MAG: hypothetical protein ACOX4U_03510 [Anaerovoracaceae bacterium]|jgi:hypothetical protein
MEWGKKISIIAAVVMIGMGAVSISYAYWTEEMKIIGECTFEHRIIVNDNIEKQKKDSLEMPKPITDGVKEDFLREEEGEAMLPQSMETDLTPDTDDVDHKESMEDGNPEL